MIDLTLPENATVKDIVTAASKACAVGNFVTYTKWRIFETTKGGYKIALETTQTICAKSITDKV